jgi:exodeoxyribonuclease V beta subunit
MLRDLRLTRLPLLGCTVAEACPDAAGSEWHFQLPVGRGLSPRVLAEVFKRHGHSDYAPLLAALDQDEVPGYLHGFIDRLAFHDDRWGVIDWKTNRLGDTAAAHRDPASLLACAMRSHYLLQMHLYLVALRRYLGPDTPPPAAWLVFLRGVRADSPDGVLEIQPAAALLDDLDGLFQRPA